MSHFVKSNHLQEHVRTEVINSKFAHIFILGIYIWNTHVCINTVKYRTYIFLKNKHYQSISMFYNLTARI